MLMLCSLLSEFHFCMSIEISHSFMFFNRYHEPLDVASLQRLTRKNFSNETMKKISWVFNMY